MADHIKKTLAKLLAEWLKDDFEFLIDEPSYKEIEKTLEECEE